MRFSKVFIFLVLFLFFVLKLVAGNENFTISNNVSFLSSENFNLRQIFDDVGIPFQMREPIFNILKDKGFLSATEQFGQESSPRDYGHEGGGGCSDSFAVFGFLAFLLALIDLLVRLGVIMATGRKRRSSIGEKNSDGICLEDPRAMVLREGTLASYSLLRGFLNSMTTNDPICSNRFFCEATQEAAKLGQVGASFARVSSPNAGAWLKKIDAETHDGVEEAGLHGIYQNKNQTCKLLYPCKEVPKPYKFPALFAISSKSFDNS